MALEALAINYLIHSAWAWISFLTAALSFWKVNSNSPLPPPPPPHHHHSPSSQPPPPPQKTAVEPDPDQQKLPPTTTTFCTLENRRSSKFMVYYGGEDDSIAIVRKERRRITGSVINPPDGWETLLKLKTAEMGWYRYQDLTQLNGSVVQLWNHHVALDY